LEYEVEGFSVCGREGYAINGAATEQLFP
jgi:hypothetical protein